MARKPNVLPSYLLHAQSGQARVRINGKVHLLGPFGSDESRLRYAELVSRSAAGLSVDPLGNRGRLPRNEPGEDPGPSVAELLLAFKRHADGYYVVDGKATAQVDCFNSAMRPVRELFAMLPARDFARIAHFAQRKTPPRSYQVLVGVALEHGREASDGGDRLYSAIGAV